MYLSGRRDTSLQQTQQWLTQNNFPLGMVILRPKGVRTLKFKTDQLKKLKDRYTIQAHIGDSEDDSYASDATNVLFVYAEPNKWTSTDLKAVLKC